MMSRSGFYRAAAIAMALISTPAMAHPDHDTLSIFAGLAHPLTGIDHLVAMIAIGFIAAKQQNLPAWQLPATFVIMMAIGVTSGGIGIAALAPEFAMAGCLLLSGFALLKERDLASWLTLILAAVSGLAHGLAHAYDNAGILLPWQYVMGALCMTVILHLVGMFGGKAIFRFPTEWHIRGWRGIGLLTTVTGAAVISS